MKIKDDELIKIMGGAFSASMFNAIWRGIDTLYNLGKSIGYSVHRFWYRGRC